MVLLLFKSWAVRVGNCIVKKLPPEKKNGDGWNKQTKRNFFLNPPKQIRTLWYLIFPAQSCISGSHKWEPRDVCVSPSLLPEQLNFEITLGCSGI